MARKPSLEEMTSFATSSIPAEPFISKTGPKGETKIVIRRPTLVERLRRKLLGHY